MRPLTPKKTRKFNGKIYTLWGYKAMKSEARDLVEKFRRDGASARFVPQPGHFGGWNIYTRRGK